MENGNVFLLLWLLSPVLDLPYVKSDYAIFPMNGVM